MSGKPYEMRSAAEVMKALDQASNGVQKASTKLMRLSQKFHEAHLDGDGQVLMGIGLQFEMARRAELAAIYSEAIQADPPRRPPAEDIREAMAHQAIQTKHPKLWAEYHAMKGEIDGLKLWLRNQREAISANQSLLRTERV